MVVAGGRDEVDVATLPKYHTHLKVSYKVVKSLLTPVVVVAGGRDEVDVATLPKYHTHLKVW